MPQILSKELFSKKLERKPIRDGFGEGLVELGRINPKVVVLTADLAESTRAKWFSDKYPDRFFECGVSEQAMVTVAAGLANYGKLPFACSFAAFSPGRTWEQIRTTIALNDVPAVICGLFVGVSVGPDGATHQMLEDIAMMRSLPNMTVIAPSDFLEAKKAVLSLSDYGKPAYVRVPRVESEVYTAVETEFEIGKGNVVWEDSVCDVCIIAHGTMVYQSLLAARALNKKSIGATVINSHTIKPLDEKLILNYANKAGCVVVCEEHQMFGGLFSAVSECLALNSPLPCESVSVFDRFGQSGRPDQLFEEYSLTSSEIVKKSIQAVGRKKRSR